MLAQSARSPLAAGESKPWLPQALTASAAFALGRLWLLRDWAPAEWRTALFRLEQRDLFRAFVTAELLSEEASGPLAPVGGGRAKDGALAVIRQVLGEAFGVNVPLRTAVGQSKKDLQRSPSAPLVPGLQATEHPDLLQLTQPQAQAALPLEPLQQSLYDALRPALAALGESWHAASHRHVGVAAIARH